jgi:hypothetical protein
VHSRHHVSTALLASLLSLATTHHARAQSADLPTATVGAARVSLEAAALLQPQPGYYSLTATGSFLRFVSERWQLGLSSSLSGFTGQGQTSLASTVAGTANFVVGASRLRGYVGGYVGGGAASHGSGATIYGGQLGALYFLAPTVALRTELRSRKASYPGSIASAEALLTIDPYLFGAAGSVGSLPSLGAVDAWGYAYASVVGIHAQDLRVIVAPFLTSWVQVGSEYDLSTFVWNGSRQGTYLLNGFARLYAPLPPRAVPFLHGFAESSTNADGDPAGGLTSYGAMGGIRHYFNPGAALDVGVQWRRHTDFALNFRLPDQLTLQARVVTQLHLR